MKDPQFFLFFFNKEENWFKKKEIVARFIFNVLDTFEDPAHNTQPFGRSESSVVIKLPKWTPELGAPNFIKVGAVPDL